MIRQNDEIDDSPDNSLADDEEFPAPPDDFEEVMLKDTRGRRAGTGKRIRPDIKSKMSINPEAALDIALNDLTKNLGIKDDNNKPTKPPKPNTSGISAMFQK